MVKKSTAAAGVKPAASAAAPVAPAAPAPAAAQAEQGGAPENGTVALPDQAAPAAPVPAEAPADAGDAPENGAVALPDQAAPAQAPVQTPEIVEPVAGLEQQAAELAPLPEAESTVLREANPGSGAIVPIDELIERRDQVEGIFGVKVTGPAQGRRRAGHAFGPEPVIIALEDLDDEQLRGIDADPKLSWSIVQLETEA